jgi:hypothetical protein
MDVASARTEPSVAGEPIRRRDDTDRPAGPPVQQRVFDELRRAAAGIAALQKGLSTPPAPEALPPDAGRRLGALLSRRLVEVEGSVTVAMALAERTGGELREELRRTTDELAEQLDAVAGMARAAAARPSQGYDARVQEARFDEVHRRLDAVTRELRSGVAALTRAQATLPSPYGEQVAKTLGRRIEGVEGEVAVASALAERVGVETREELGRVAGENERRLLAAQETLSLLADRVSRLEGHSRTPFPADLELRVAELEREREVVEDRLHQATEIWKSERVALQERVSELAARIVTGPIPQQAEGDTDVWPTARAFDQLRIAVEGLRMRVGYHEKTVAELAEERDVDDRIDEMHRLLRRLESARAGVNEEPESALERIERVALRMDERLQQLESAGSRTGAA